MKFELGQKVKIKADGEIGEVLSIHADSNGVSYAIASKEVDLAAKKILEGVKTCMEDELEAVEDLPVEETAQEVQPEEAHE